MLASPRLAYLIEPRFPGGTSGAAAAEFRALDGHLCPHVHDARSQMFPGREIAPILADTLAALSWPLDATDAPVSAETVIVPNPAFLKFQSGLGRRIFCRDLVVVTHENFLRPGGTEGFDVAACLSALDRASLALRKWLAPVSLSNRATVAEWLDRAGHPAPWRLLPQDWFNICDAPLLPPVSLPRDRRGRLSRPGWEKFPSQSDLDLCFPETAETNLLLGADHLLRDGIVRPHWQMLAFGSLPVADFFDRIDFLVHFTAPAWQESFGRVLAEGIAAGKVVLSDPMTAANFGGAVIACQPAQVDALIAHYISEPAAYHDQVRRGQAVLGRYSPAAFRALITSFPPNAMRAVA